MTDGAASTETGAALLEAVVALAAVAVLVAGGADLHRSIVAARLASERAVAALTAATATAERARAGPLDAEHGVVVEAATVSSLWRRRDCDDGHVVLREVPVRPASTSDAVGTLRVVAPAVTDAVVVAVRTGAGDPAPGAVVDVTAADGTRSTRTADAAGCVDLGRSPGPVRLAATTGVGGTGAAAVAGGHAAIGRHAVPAAPLPVTVVGSGQVTVVIATDGALPERIDDGHLAWWRGGGSGGPTAAPGESLVLPEGRHAVVVGACADPRAGGSAAAVTVTAGGDEVVTVPLGHVLVPRPDVDDGRRLVLRRQRPCPGGSLRPTLTWDVGGGGGTLAAAVPDGVWEAVVEGPGGTRLRGPVAVRIGAAVEVLPSW